MVSDRRQCIFCGERGKLTDEHVLPKWIVKMLDVSGPVFIEATLSGTTARVHRRQDLNIRLKKRVCQKCNTTWMSQLENSVKPFLTSMILNNNSVELNIADQQQLAIWALKTAFVLELAWQQLYPSARPKQGYTASDAELAWITNHSMPPPRSRVWIGGIDAKHRLTLGHSTNSLQVHFMKLEVIVPCHLTTFHIGYLAFQVFSVDFVIADSVGMSEFDISPPEELRNFFTTLWPRLHSNVSWPQKYFFDDSQWNEVSNWIDRYSST